MLILRTWLPPNNLTLNKQEQFTPIGREPSELLALMLGILAVFGIGESQEQKAQVSKKTSNGNDAITLRSTIFQMEAKCFLHYLSSISERHCKLLGLERR